MSLSRRDEFAKAAMRAIELSADDSPARVGRKAVAIVLLVDALISELDRTEKVCRHQSMKNALEQGFYPKSCPDCGKEMR